LNDDVKVLHSVVSCVAFRLAVRAGPPDTLPSTVLFGMTPNIFWDSAESGMACDGPGPTPSLPMTELAGTVGKVCPNAGAAESHRTAASK
jgi:hypothetical protein